MTLPLPTVDMRALAVAEKVYDIAVSSPIGQSTQTIAKIQVMLIEIIDAEHLRSLPAGRTQNQQKGRFSNEELRRMADVAAQTQASNTPLPVAAQAQASNTPLPVHGYTPQPDAKVALVNEFKQDEERLLRKLDALTDVRNSDVYIPPTGYDQRWLAIARTHFQEGWMALNRAVFQPQRITLPEDEGK